MGFVEGIRYMNKKHDINNWATFINSMLTNSYKALC